MLAIAGSLLGEISLPKLALSWIFIGMIPTAILGVAPLIFSAWVSTFPGRITQPSGIGPVSLLGLLSLLGAIGWYGGRPLFRVVERSFWSMNSLILQPGYAVCREGLRHLMERFLSPGADQDKRVKLRASGAVGAGAIGCLIACLIALWSWPFTRWSGDLMDFADPLRLVASAFANAVTVMAAYLAVASLAWGVADGLMDQPRDLKRFDEAPTTVRRWRVAHLSDVHVVAEQYGFRIESGRAGPRGNERFAGVLEKLDAINAVEPLDLLLMTGDMTDAGRSAEWAEFFDAFQRYDALAQRTLILPGNHDINIVDRTNPARLELPTSPGKRLRQMRTLSAMAAVQGDRVQVFDTTRTKLAGSLADMLEPSRLRIATFADAGGLRRSAGLAAVWADSFPMVLPPREPGGLGVLLFNSNAEAHFSFTNALGLVAEEDIRAGLAIIDAYPEAGWILALHHHLVEYPKKATAFSERIGTALINGSRLVRMLKPVAHRVVVMHGHRHIDWIGRCGALTIVSAPSPVMEATNADPAHFYIHTLSVTERGVALLTPQRVDIGLGSS